MADCPSNMQEWVSMAEAACATAKTPAERQTYANIAAAARSVAAGALDSDPIKQAAYTRMAQAFAEQDAAVAARTAEVQGALNSSIEMRNTAGPQAPINSSFSLLRGRLPERVQATLERLDDQLDEVRGQRRNLVDEQQDLIQERGKIVVQIRIHTEPAVGSRYGVTVMLAESHPTIIKLRGDLSKVDKRLAKITAKLEESQPRFSALDRLVVRCRDYVRDMLNQRVEFVFDGGKPGKKTSSDLKAAIADVRKTIEELNSDLRQLMARPRRSADVKAAAKMLVDATAKPPLVSQAIDHGDPIKWPTALVTAEVVGGITLDGQKVPIPSHGAGAFGGINDALGILVWAHKEAIFTAMEREIDLYADDANALSDEDRALGKSDLLQKILVAERLEEQLVKQAEQDELLIHRRAEADPRVVLGLADHMPAMVEDVI